MRPHPADALINQAFLAIAEEMLDAEAFAEARKEGRAMTLDAAVQQALLLQPATTRCGVAAVERC